MLIRCVHFGSAVITGYHGNRIIDEKHVLLYEQMVRIL